MLNWSCAELKLELEQDARNGVKFDECFKGISNTCLLALHCISYMCLGRIEVQDIILSSYSNLFSQLSALLNWLAEHICLPGSFERPRCFYLKMATVISRTYRGFCGRHAKQLALEKSAVEGLIAVLASADALQRKKTLSISLAENNYLGDELSLAIEHLTARDIKAWNQVEVIAGPRGLLSLTTLGRVPLQILALTSLRSLVLNVRTEAFCICLPVENDVPCDSSCIDEVASL